MIQKNNQTKIPCYYHIWLLNDHKYLGEPELADVGGTIDIDGDGEAVVWLAVDGLKLVEGTGDKIVVGIVVDVATVGEGLVGRLFIGVMMGIGLRVVETLIMYLLANAPALLPQ